MPVEDVASETEKIMDVIKGEYKAYFEKDQPGWSDKFVQADHLRFWGYWEGYPDKVRHYDSWKDLYEGKKNRFEIDTAGYWNENEPVMDIHDLNVQIRGKVAWVTFRQRSKDGKTDAFLGESLETKILEKIAGKWKIAYANFLYLPMEDTAGGK